MSISEYSKEETDIWENKEENKNLKLVNRCLIHSRHIIPPFNNS